MTEDQSNSSQTTGDSDLISTIEGSVDFSAWHDSYTSQLTTTARKAQIKGFRAGRVPVSLIKQRYGQAILEDVCQSLVRDSLSQKCEDEELRVADIKELDYDVSNLGSSGEANQPLNWTAQVVVFPEVSLVDWSSLSMKQSTCEISDADRDTAVEQGLESLKTWEESGEPAQNGWKVHGPLTVSDEASGEAIENLSRDLVVTVGEHEWEELNGALIGIKADAVVSGVSALQNAVSSAEKNFEAGSKVAWEFTASKVESPVLADENEHRDGIVERFEQRVAAQLKARNKSQVMEALVGAYQFSVPSRLIDEEYRGQWMQQLRAMGMDPSKFPLDSLPENPEMRASAEKSVKLSLIIDAINKDSDLLEVADDDISNDLKRQLEEHRQQLQAGMSDEDFANQLQSAQTNPQLRNQVRGGLVEERLVEHARSEGTIENVNITTDELFGASAPS